MEPIRRLQKWLKRRKFLRLQKEIQSRCELILQEMVQEADQISYWRRLRDFEIGRARFNEEAIARFRCYLDVLKEATSVLTPEFGEYMTHRMRFIAARMSA